MIRDFLSAAGLIQAVRGFDADMVLMNPGFEREVVPGALDDLLDSLVSQRPVGMRHRRQISSRDPISVEIVEAATRAASEKIPRSAQVGARPLAPWN